jgi:acyl carrier protein
MVATGPSAFSKGFECMTVEEVIRETLMEVLDSTGAELAAPLVGDTVLLNSGLDSLGFAVLVASLEEKLGYDPFIVMAEPVYPRTFAEFVGIYERHKPA